jgi:peptidyl-prolyl cis-trans isomerase C
MGRNTKIIFICSMLLALAAAGCRHKQKEEGVLYKIGNSSITDEDVVMVGQSFPEPVQIQYMDRKGRQELLDNMVALELLYQEALKQKLDQDPNLKFQLERGRKNYLAQQVVERSLKVEDLYNFYQDNFIRLDGIRIIIKAPGTDADKNAARSAVNAIFESLKNGADFNQLKLRNNPDQKQDLGYFSRSNVIKQFGAEAAAALFGMQQGDKQKFTTPVMHENSYYILYIMEYPQSLDPKGYDLVWEQIADAKREEIFRGLISDLRSQIPVKKNDENIEKFLQVGDEWQKKMENPPPPQPGATAAPAPGGTGAQKQPLPGMTGAAPAPNQLKGSTQSGATVKPKPGPAPAK